MMRQAGLAGGRHGGGRRPPSQTRPLGPGRCDPPGFHRRRGQDQHPVVRRHHLPRDLGGLAVPITVIDIASRRVVGFALAGHLRTELVADALANAVAARDPEAGVIFHSDRGCQPSTPRPPTPPWPATARVRDNARESGPAAGRRCDLCDKWLDVLAAIWLVPCAGGFVWQSGRRHGWVCCDRRDPGGGAASG